MLYQVGLAGPTYTDSGLTNGTTYQYYVCAVNKDGEGDQSNEVSAVPGSTPLAPTKLAATAGNGQVSLTWNTVNNAYSYNVYRSTTPGGEGSAPVATGWNGYTDSGLTNGTTYYYTVTAVNEDGEGAASNEASATPSVPPLPAPALSATAASGQVSLTWTAVAGASSYNLYRYGGGNDWNWTLLQVGLTSTSDTDTGLTDGTTYQYYVCAVSKDGQGSQSNQVSVLPGGPALALAAHVVWTSDYTTNPPAQTASTSGAFGGNATLHLTLTGPQTLWWGGAATATVRVHEVAAPDAAGDLVWTGVPLYGSPSAACGEPSASPPPFSTQCYLDLPWTAGGFNGNAGGFNGNYVVTATVQATVGGSATPQTVLLSSPLTVDREDLLITGTSPANPTPLLWNGTGPVTVTANVSAAYKANGSATLNIYASDQTFIKALPAQSFVTGGGPVSFTWDGSKADGTPAVPGIYLFQFNASDSQGLSDTDKSPFLSVTSPSTVTVASDNGTTAVYQVAYTVISNDNPTRSGSSGSIDVYDPTLSKIYSQALASSNLTPGMHTVSVSIPSAQVAGEYVFLISPLDNDANHDRGHRLRYALQHNDRGDYPGVIAWAYSGTGGTGGVEQNMAQEADSFFAGMHKIGYNELAAPYHDWYHDPVLSDIRGPLEKPISGLVVAAIIGHGSIDGRVLQVSHFGLVPSYNKYLVTQGAYDNTNYFPNSTATPRHTHYAINSKFLAQDHLRIEDIDSGNIARNNQLHYLKLVLLSGCDMNYVMKFGIEDELWNSGVQCLVVLGQHNR